MTAERGQLAGHAVAETPGPVLRVEQNGVTGSEQVRALSAQVVELPPQVQAARQERREGDVERVSFGTIRVTDLIKYRVLVVRRDENARGVGHEDGGRAMGHRNEGADALLLGRLRQACKQPGLDRGDVQFTHR